MFLQIHHGANLQPESLEIGEPKVAGTASFDELRPAYIIAYSGDTFQGNPISTNGFQYNGIPSSITFILCNNIGALQVGLNSINTIDQKGDKIITCFSIPRLAVKTYLDEHEEHDPQTTTYLCAILNNYTQSVITKTLVSTPSTIDGYSPRNQKLRTYPYVYLGFNPANGSQKVYRYEDFANGTPIFNLYSEINPNPSVYLIPQNYRGASGNSLSDSSTLNGYPTISYSNDVFNSWLAQNSSMLQINREREQLSYAQTKAGQKLSALGNAISLGSSIANLDVGGAVNSLSSLGSTGISAISNEASHELNVREQMAQVEAQKLVPDQVSLSSSNATLLGYDLLDENIFTRYNIKAEFARKIDKYFDMFGYSTNELKVPNINNRPTWNYVKTLACNINANIPQADLAEIKDMFNSGITLWHNTTNFKNYYANNR